MLFFKNIFKKKQTKSIIELSNKRPLVLSNMNADTIKKGVQENARRLSDPDFAEQKLNEELKHLL